MTAVGLVAAVDVGSSAVKGVVLTRTGQVRAEHSVGLHTEQPQPGYAEQDPEMWWQALREICLAWAADGVPLGELAALALSGQMQDTVLTRGGRPCAPALLYSDVRATQEADEVAALVADPVLGDVVARTGNPHTAGSVLPKLRWLQRHAPEQLAGQPRLHVGAKDVLTERLCGEHVTDHTTAATTGLYDLAGHRWHAGWPAALGLDLGLPRLCWPGEVVGRVGAAVGADLGLPPGLPVLAGLGDAGATTLGAGVCRPGERYAYLGTSGWLGLIARPGTAQPDRFQLPLLVPGEVLAVAPLSNAGSAHRWAADTFAGGDYQVLERLVSASSPTGVLCLPYLAGERSPVQDPDARGVFLGLHSQTGPGDLARAVLEGVAYALRATAEAFGPSPQAGPLTLLGGGARSAAWCQILADVLNTEVVVPELPELLPVLGSAYTAFSHLGWTADYPEYRRQILDAQRHRRVHPDPGRIALHERQFGRFQQLYPAVRSLF